jgi:hypothetical protein
MSQENMEKERVANAAFNRGGMDSAFEFYAADAEVRDLLNGPDQPSVVQGPAAAREAVALWYDPDSRGVRATASAQCTSVRELARPSVRRQSRPDRQPDDFRVAAGSYLNSGEVEL